MFSKNVIVDIVDTFPDYHSDLGKYLMEVELDDKIEFSQGSSIQIKKNLITKFLINNQDVKNTLNQKIILNIIEDRIENFLLNDFDEEKKEFKTYKNLYNYLKHDGYDIDIENKKLIKILQDDYENEEKSQEVCFEDVQKKIIEQLKKAKYTIWIAVAWFTDEILFKELLRKKEEGLNIQIIINDDEINKEYGFNYEKYFETHKLKKSNHYGNIMHNKFCIIDLKTVIHGSYNWTNKAQYNKETVSIDANRAFAEEFADEFIKLKATHKI